MKHEAYQKKNQFVPARKLHIYQKLLMMAKKNNFCLFWDPNSLLNVKAGSTTVL
jgi:hypothetical protein